MNIRYTFKLSIYILIIALFPFNTYAQEIKSSEVTNNENTETKKDINPLRIGVKIGIPSIITLGVEYVTPLLDNRVAFAVDYFPLRINLLDVNTKFNNFEIGSNIYLNNKGKGLYGGLSYYNFNGNATNITEVEFDDGSIGTGETTIKFNTFNLKVGAKLGKAFYFRIELGYGFGKLPETITIVSEDGSSSSIEEIGEVSFLSSSGVPIFNFGFGYSFL